MTAEKGCSVVVVRWPCCDGLLGKHFKIAGIAEPKEEVTCTTCKTVHKVKGPLYRYKAGSTYFVPADWTRPLLPLDDLEHALNTPAGIAAERLGVTPESFRQDGIESDWWRNPENMPPPPGSIRWVKKGSPLWDAFNRMFPDEPEPA